jgi:hypothetical protein
MTDGAQSKPKRKRSASDLHDRTYIHHMVFEDLPTVRQHVLAREWTVFILWGVCRNRRHLLLLGGNCSCTSL